MPPDDGSPAPLVMFLASSTATPVDFLVLSPADEVAGVEPAPWFLLRVGGDRLLLEFDSLAAPIGRPIVEPAT